MGVAAIICQVPLHATHCAGFSHILSFSSSETCIMCLYSKLTDKGPTVWGIWDAFLVSQGWLVSEHGANPSSMLFPYPVLPYVTETHVVNSGRNAQL